MIAIVDYGVGNLFSLRCSLSALGQDALVTGDARAIRSADRIILPGVGAFGDAAQKLRATGLADTVKEEAAKGKLLLGICLGNVSVFVRNDFLRGVAGALLVIGIIAAGTSLLILTEGKLSLIHYIAAAAAAVLLPVSTKAMLAYYKKNCWLEDR